MPELYANDAITQLSSLMNIGDVTVHVVSATGFPLTGNFRIKIDQELMLVTAVLPLQWTVTRAVEPVGGVQVATPHNAGAVVIQVLTAASIQAVVPPPQLTDVQFVALINAALHAPLQTPRWNLVGANWEWARPGWVDQGQTWAAQQVFMTGVGGSAPLILRPTGGIPITNDVYLFADATGIEIQQASAGRGLRVDLNAAAYIWNYFVVGLSTAGGSPIYFGFNFDASLAKIAPSVVGPNGGWLQNTAGRATLLTDVPVVGTVLTNLTDLTRTLQAGRIYTGRLVLYVDNTTPGDGAVIDFGGGTATATSFVAGFSAQPAYPGVNIVGFTATHLTDALNVMAASVATVIYLVDLLIVVNAGGTIVPRFSELSSSGGTATVRAGSFLWLEDMP